MPVQRTAYLPVTTLSGRVTGDTPTPPRWSRDGVQQGVEVGDALEIAASARGW